MKSCESTVAFADGQFISNFARSRAVWVALPCLWSSVCCCVAQLLALMKASTLRTISILFLIIGNIIFLLCLLHSFWSFSLALKRLTHHPLAEQLQPVR